ncbi:MAG: hypothetical protein NTV21_14520 [Planctomycetota bacterium]|nr:hypothetical protein [Planctomycetota bacterium]
MDEQQFDFHHIAGLPMRAQAAFAGRCLRAVLPELGRNWPEGEKNVEPLLKLVIAAAEDIGAKLNYRDRKLELSIGNMIPEIREAGDSLADRTDQILDRIYAEHGARFSRPLGDRSSVELEELTRIGPDGALAAQMLRAYRIVRAGLHTLSVVTAALGDSDGKYQFREEQLSVDVVRAARLAHSVGDDAARAFIVGAYQKLMEFRRFLVLDRPISSSFFDSVRGYADTSAASGRSDALELVIELPSDVSDDEVVSTVAELVRLADAVHRARGGHGLVLDSVRCEQTAALEVEP